MNNIISTIKKCNNIHNKLRKIIQIIRELDKTLDA